MGEYFISDDMGPGGEGVFGIAVFAASEAEARGRWHQPDFIVRAGSEPGRPDFVRVPGARNAGGQALPDPLAQVTDPALLTVIKWPAGTLPRPG